MNMKSNDEYIELILQFIYKIPDQHCYLSELPIIDGNYLSDYESKRNADKLVSKGLMERDDERVDITDFGREVYEIGGWKEFLKQQKEQAEEQLSYAAEREALKTKNLVLMNEKMEYENTNRSQIEKINKLTLENLKLQNIQSYYKIGTGILSLVSFFLGYWLFK